MNTTLNTLNTFSRLKLTGKHLYAFEILILMLLIAYFLASPADAATDEFFTEPTDFWERVTTGTGTKLALAVGGSVVIVSLIGQRYVAIFIVVAIYVFGVFFLPAIIGSVNATMAL